MTQGQHSHSFEGRYSVISVSKSSPCAACLVLKPLQLSDSMVEIKPSREDSRSPRDVDRHEGGQYRLLYSKSKVYVNPTPYARDNIPGFVALVKRVRSDCACALSPLTYAPHRRRP